MKKIRKILFWSAGILTLLVLILFVHIAIMVKGMPRMAQPTMQLGRADFSQPVSNEQALQICKQVKNTTGVTDTYFNPKYNTLVYSFDNRKNTAENIYAETIENCGVPSHRFIVKKEDMGKGCPVMDDNSFSGKVTRFVAGIVN